MTAITTANTASDMVRSATSIALRVAARELELYDTGNVDGADEVFAADVIDHNPATDAASLLLERLDDDALHVGIGDLPGDTRPGLVGQTVQTAVEEASPPGADRVRRHVQPS